MYFITKNLLDTHDKSVHVRSQDPRGTNTVTIILFGGVTHFPQIYDTILTFTDNIPTMY